MGWIDTVTKDYMKRNEVFADAFNYFIYHGRQVINPDDLQELDTTEIAIPFGNGDEVAVQKFRDILKATTLMMDEKAAYLILGMENESDVKYAEPVKNGLYDFLQYSKQVQQIAADHRKAKDYKGHDSGEFLSGFYKEDKITPVVTLVVLFGAKKWDGPRTLQKMMSTQDPDILDCVANYKLNLIEPAALSAEDLEKFRTNLRAVLGFIKYSNNPDELETFLSQEEELQALDVEAVRVISACTNTDIPIDEKAEVVDVCVAVTELNRRAAEKARLETLCADIKNAMEGFNASLEAAMAVLKVSAEDREAIKKML